MPLSVLVPLRDIDGLCLYCQENDGKLRAGIASLGHYGEWYLDTLLQEMPSQA